MSAVTAVDLARMVSDMSAQAPTKKYPASPAWLTPPAANDNLGRVADALRYISPDVGRGNGSIIGPDGQPVENYWFGVVLAVRRGLGPDGEAVLRSWSQGSERYEEKAFDQAWAAFDPLHTNPVNLASVYALARAKGWIEPVQRPAQLLASASRYALLDRAAIMAIAPLEWRVKGLFPKTGMGVVFGPSGSGKSFLVLDLANSIANGQPWFGRRTAACPVTYVSLEGEAGLQNRLKAMELHSRDEISKNFKAITQPFNFGEEQDVVDLAAALPRDGVVIIDTLNRASPGLDENSGKDMGLILEAGKRLQVLTNSLVLVVHHTGKDTSRGMRGHSSLHAALDGAIEVELKDQKRLWRATKVKDGADGAAVPFKLELVPLGRDTDGELMSSCAIGPAILVTPPRAGPTGSSQRLALKAIRQVISQSSHRGCADSGSETLCLKMEDGVSAVAAVLLSAESNKMRNRARALIQALTEKSFLGAGTEFDEDWLWCIDR